MTTYNTYVSIPHSSYDEWKTNTLGNQYDVDGSPIPQPYQCWDFAAEFWNNVGFIQGMPTTAGTHAAYGIWDAKEVNAGNKFDLIYDKTQIKRGDVIIYNYFPQNEFGHVGFADEDYSGNDNLQILSQNNDHNYVTVHGYNLAYFRGAFRLKAWNSNPVYNLSQGKFPWYLYARKLRRIY